MSIISLSNRGVFLFEWLVCLKFYARGLVLEPICGFLAAPLVCWLVIHSATREMFFFEK